MSLPTNFFIARGGLKLTPRIFAMEYNSGSGEGVRIQALDTETFETLATSPWSEQYSSVNASFPNHGGAGIGSGMGTRMVFANDERLYYYHARTSTTGNIFCFDPKTLNLIAVSSDITLINQMDNSNQISLQNVDDKLYFQLNDGNFAKVDTYSGSGTTWAANAVQTNNNQTAAGKRGFFASKVLNAVLYGGGNSNGTTTTYLYPNLSSWGNVNQYGFPNIYSQNGYGQGFGRLGFDGNQSVTGFNQYQNALTLYYNLSGNNGFNYTTGTSASTYIYGTPATNTFLGVGMAQLYNGQQIFIYNAGSASASATYNWNTSVPTPNGNISCAYNQGYRINYDENYFYFSCTFNGNINTGNIASVNNGVNASFAGIMKYDPSATQVILARGYLGTNSVNYNSGYNRIVDICPMLTQYQQETGTL